MATIDIATLAAALETDPRTTRKFLRSITPRDEQPGKGGRWSIEKRAVRSLHTRFSKWSAEQEKARQERLAQKATDATDSLDTDSLDEVTDAEPTQDQLDAIDAE